jgi:endonuclease/exonuclease/phosphatase family metal-dependent hydrolase
MLRRALLILVAAASPSAAGDASSTLRVLSYNVAGIPLVQRLASERILKLAGELGAYDLVALQEVWSGYDYQRLKRASGFPSAVRQEDPPVGNGLVLLSRLRVVEWRFYPYSGRAAPHALFTKVDADAICTKGVLAARLETEDGEQLDVYDTHLISGDSPIENDFVRVAQVLELDAAMRDFSRGRPYLLLGDFNVGAGTFQHKLILDILGLDDPCWQGGKERCGSTFGGERIDYVLGQAGGASLAFTRPFEVEGAPILLSDHLGGIQATVELPLEPMAEKPRRRPALEAARQALRTGQARLSGLSSRWPPVSWYLAWWRSCESARVDALLAKLDAELAAEFASRGH